MWCWGTKWHQLIVGALSGPAHCAGPLRRWSARLNCARLPRSAIAHVAEASEADHLHRPGRWLGGRSRFADRDVIQTDGNVLLSLGLPIEVKGTLPWSVSRWAARDHRESGEAGTLGE
jgi:hypothetical protein